MPEKRLALVEATPEFVPAAGTMAARPDVQPATPRPHLSGQPLPRDDAGGWHGHPEEDQERIRNSFARPGTSRRLLDQLHQTDLPQFTRWLNTHFGALLTESREVSQKLAADEALVLRVQNEMMFGASSDARAYQQVVELRENLEPPPPQDDGTASEGRDPFGARLDGHHAAGSALPKAQVPLLTCAQGRWRCSGRWG